MIYIPENRKNKVNLIGFWPYPETTPENKELIAREFQVLCYSYNVAAQLINEPEEALFNSGPIVCVEEWTNSPDQINLIDFEHPRECIYITGSSKYRWPSAKFNADYRIYFRTPNLSPLYGSQSHAIVINDRYIKNADL